MLAKNGVRQVPTQQYITRLILLFITCIYIFVYIRGCYNKRVQVYIRGISLVRTSPNSATKQQQTGLHE